jgi:hypothetical protein
VAGLGSGGGVTLWDQVLIVLPSSSSKSNALG